MEDENNSECSTEFNENLKEMVMQQYYQIWKLDKRSRKYKLTIERRLDKKHFDAVFKRVGTFVQNFGQLISIKTNFQGHLS